jgi:DNA-binding transcriptional regulator YiaG
MSRTAGLARARRLAANGTAKRIRLDSGISQAEMARDVGASQATISRWEGRSRVPTGDAALLWLALLDELERL